jgi:hypothetical protein
MREGCVEGQVHIGGDVRYCLSDYIMDEGNWGKILG